MAYEAKITFFPTFAKKLNSTKRPTSDLNQIWCSGDLRDNCSIYYPTIEIAKTTLYNNYSPSNAINDILKCSYMTIRWNSNSSTDDMYYYIKNVTISGSTLIVQGEIDYLANYKDQIKTGTRLWERRPLKSTELTDEISAIPDELMGKKGTIKHYYFKVRDYDAPTNQTCTFVITFVSSTGGIAVVATTLKEIINMMKQMYEDPYTAWENWATTKPEGFQQTYVDPTTFIKRIVQLPYTISQVAGANKVAYKYYIGFSGISITGYSVKNSSLAQDGGGSTVAVETYNKTIVESYDITMPSTIGGSDKPLSMFRSDYMNIYLNFGVFGTIEVDPADVFCDTATLTSPSGDYQVQYENGYLSSVIEKNVYIDPGTGLADMTLKFPNSKVITMSANIGREIFLTNVVNDLRMNMSKVSVGLAQSVVTGITGAGKLGTVTTQAMINNGDYNDANELMGLQNANSLFSNLSKGNEASFTTTISNILGGLTGGIVDTIKGGGTTVTQSGTSTGSIPTYGGMMGTVIYSEPLYKLSDVNVNFGRKVMKVMSMGDTGYYKLAYNDYDINAPKFVKDVLNSYLMGGFFYE